MDILKKYLVRVKAFFSGVDWKHTRLLKFALGGLLVAFITLMFPSSESIEFKYEVGSVWIQKDLIAPFSFPIYKDPVMYERELQSAADSVYPVVIRHPAIEQAQAESLGFFIDELRRVAGIRSRWLKMRSPEDSAAFDQARNSFPFPVTEEEWEVLDKWRLMEAREGHDSFSLLKKILKADLAEIYKVGLLDVETLRQPRRRLALRHGTMEDIVSSAGLYTEAEALSQLRTWLEEQVDPGGAASIAITLLGAVVRPNVLFDRSATERAYELAQESVPRTLGYVQENERIVSEHDRITPETRLKLDSFRRAKAERGAEHSLWSQRLGIFFHVGLILALFTIYLFLFRKRIFSDNSMLALIALLLLMETFLAYLSLRLPVAAPLQYLIVIPAASMLLTIIFDSRVAFYGTVTMAFLIAGIRGNDYTIALTSLVAGALGAYTVRDIRQRTQIFRSLGFILLGYTVAIIALALERFESIETVTVELTFALTNAVISPVLTYGLLIFFERVFRVATDLTLLELSDFNHPLLRKLSEEAPGTFHHSMTLGNLAESAAEAIGANTILARVGAYYHDVGKTANAQYFVENQSGSLSRHAKLRPKMSAAIIIAHVRDGMALARSYGVPEKVVEFIPQHHGTTRVSYFYARAIKLASSRKSVKEPVREEDFRYPGPKPQSKEAGIVMLADSVEASTRAQESFSTQELESAIENMIRQRFLEGELDECDLTLKDLTKIKEAFLKILTGIHHQRIKYPEQESSAPADAPPPPVERAPTVTESQPPPNGEAEPGPEPPPPVAEEQSPRAGEERDDPERESNTPAV